jgi:hypothetical protein
MTEPIKITLMDVVHTLKKRRIHAGYCEYFAGIDNPGTYLEPVPCSCWVDAESVTVIS